LNEVIWMTTDIVTITNRPPMMTGSSPGRHARRAPQRGGVETAIPLREAAFYGPL